MNNAAPENTAALQEKIAELEQQLKLSDEGVSQLAQRCLELEQQLLACQTELAKHSAEAENITLTLPQLFYDTGSGFSPRECLTATEDVYNELTHEVSVTFVLPEDARAIRLDPGELACCITDLAISDERISFQSVNGLLLQEDSLLFLDVDPNLSLHCTTGFGAGMKFAVNYHYYPLGRFLHEQPGKSLLRALNELKLKNAAAAQEADEMLQASRAEHGEAENHDGDQDFNQREASGFVGEEGRRSAKVLHGVAILGYWGVARCAFCLRVFAVDLDAGRWLRSIFYLRVYPRHAPALCMPLHSRYIRRSRSAVVSSELLRW